MFSISEYMHPRKTTQGQRYVIPGKDQGPHLHAQYSADQDKCETSSLDSWSRPGMTVDKQQ